MERMTVEEIITNRIMSKLEEGIIPWKKPWFGLPGTGNVFTNKPYGLVNQILVSHEGGYMSEKQFEENHVKITAECPKMYKADKWEKGKPMYRYSEHEGYHLITPEEWSIMTEKQKFNVLAEPIINYWQKSYIKKDENGKPMTDDDGNPVIGHYPPSMRYVMVLWAGYTDKDYKMPENTIQALKKPERLIAYYVDREGIKFNNVKGDRAYYSPSSDSITLPLFKQFKNAEEYYGTAFHEMTHSTGVEKRLGRDMKGWFGDPKYAKEELVAELGSAFLCNRFGIEQTINNSAAYIQSWLSALKNDKKLVFEAAKNATKAAEFITDGFTVEEPKEEPKAEPKAEPKEEPKAEPKKRKERPTATLEGKAKHYIKVFKDNAITAELVEGYDAKCNGNTYFINKSDHNTWNISCILTGLLIRGGWKTRKNAVEEGIPFIAETYEKTLNTDKFKQYEEEFYKIVKAIEG